MKKFIPYGRQEITSKDIDSVVKVLKSDFLTQGPLIERFEEEIKSKLHVNFAITTNSATSSLHLACLALKLSKEDILWTSPISFVASANCARYCSANVDFVDIDEQTGLISIPKLKTKLEIAKLKGLLPKIIIPVHLAGTSCDMKSIYELSLKYGFKIIEDASHALGGSYNNEPVGNCKFSDISIFSFHPVKIITTGEGGVAVTNNKDLAQNMLMNRSHGITKNTEEFELKEFGPWSYEQQTLGFNYRMNDIQASLGISQLKRLEDIIKKRNLIIKNYTELLEDCSVSLLKIPDNVITAGHLAILRLKKKDKDFHKFVFRKLRDFNIGVQLHYSPIHLQPYYRRLGFKEGLFPEAELYAQSCFSIPLFPSLKFDDQIYVSETIKKIIKP